MKLMSEQECQYKAMEFLVALKELILEDRPQSRIQINPDVLQQILPFMRSEFNPYWKYIDLSQVTAKGLKASFLDLRGTNFEDFNPQEVAGRVLYGTNLEGIDLSGKSLQGCWIEKANLTRTNVSFDPSDLINGSIRGTNLTGATLLCGPDLKGVHRDLDTVLTNVTFAKHEEQAQRPYVKEIN